jgi:NADPH:quinone reductase-like Zn-dependent oxidoreductase
MKQIEFSDVGSPQDVVCYADAEAPWDPGFGEVLVKVLAFPINPAEALAAMQ